MKPAVRQLLMSGGNSSAALFKKLTNPNAPMPAFVEGWASNTFHAQIPAVPTGISGVSADSEGARAFSITVSGAEGATSLTGAGFDTTIGADTWSAVILHDDGEYRVYTVSGITATTINVSPPLRAAVTSKTLCSLGGGTNDQHYTELGYTALGRFIGSITNQQGYRSGYADKFTARTDSASKWTAVGGLSAANPTTPIKNAFPNTGSGSYWHARGTRILQFDTAVAGRGVSRTVGLGGRSGYLEAFIGINSGTSPFNVTVTVDGVTLLNANYSAFQRVQVPFTNGITGTITITNSAASQAQYSIGDVTWWVYDRTFNTTDLVIQPNDKVVLMGDSWSARYSGGLGSHIQAKAITDQSGTGTVTTVALASQTAQWAMQQFDSQVAPLDPDVVIFEFFTNDNNAGLGIETWLQTLYQLGLKAQALGARPVFLMPLPTASQSQSAEHGKWAEYIGAGRQI